MEILIIFFRVTVDEIKSYSVTPWDFQLMCHQYDAIFELAKVMQMFDHKFCTLYEHKWEYLIDIFYFIQFM